MESSTTTPLRAIDAATVAQAFRITAREVADQTAVRTRDGATSWTWGELREQVDRLAAGLHARGLGRGETIALLMGNRPEFHLVDLAAMMTGATAFSIYAQYTPEQIQYVVQDAGAKILVCEQQFLGGVLEARKDLPGLEHVIVLDGDAPEGVDTLAEVTGGADFDLEASLAAISPQDILTLIYTSGTTGPPKGVQISHANFLAAIHGLDVLVAFPPRSRVISWLPAAHVAERTAHHYIPIVLGMEITTLENPREIVTAMGEVHPHWFFSVPRIFEKIKAGLEAAIAGRPVEERLVVQEALAAATRKVRLEQAGRPVPDDLAAAVAAADGPIFGPLRERIGLDQVVTMSVGAAPTPVEVIEFFHAIGLPLQEIWGMSETCGAGTANPPGAIRIGTVGQVTPGGEVKLASDGELLVRAKFVMPGYRNLPDKTAEALDEDGWLHTGDIATIDDDGYVKIVDRKKEIIINAAGKNMSPANIEAAVKGASPLIANCVCIGDRRSYNTALILLDADYAPAWASQQGLPGTTLAELARDPRMRAAVQEGVDAANAKLARVEQIKKFFIVEGDWAPGGDELTPTMKLKRKPIAEKYAAVIDELYLGADA